MLSLLVSLCYLSFDSHNLRLGTCIKDPWEIHHKEGSLGFLWLRSRWLTVVEELLKQIIGFLFFLITLRNIILSLEPSNVVIRQLLLSLRVDYIVVELLGVDSLSRVSRLVSTIQVVHQWEESLGFFRFRIVIIEKSESEILLENLDSCGQQLEIGIFEPVVTRGVREFELGE